MKVALCITIVATLLSANLAQAEVEIVQYSLGWAAFSTDDTGEYFIGISGGRDQRATERSSGACILLNIAEGYGSACDFLATFDIDPALQSAKLTAKATVPFRYNSGRTVNRKVALVVTFTGYGNYRPVEWQEHAFLPPDGYAVGEAGVGRQATTTATLTSPLFRRQLRLTTERSALGHYGSYMADV